LPSLLAPAGSRWDLAAEQEGTDRVEEITEEAEIVQRVAALDIGKAELVCCVRVPYEGKPGRRRQGVRSCATATRSLLELRDWLVCHGVSLCVMEVTSTYWKPPFYLLEDAAGCWVARARDVKNVPGRPKTDRLDAVWLCKLAERGMLRPSFIPPPWQRELRDLCRCRRTLIQERTREKQRAEKLLEDTQIKLSSVISDIFGASGRDMLEALIAGQRDPHALARLARGSMRGKISVLQEALTGQFRDHHGYLLRMMLDRVDALTAQIEALTARIDEAIAPFAAQMAQLDEIPGIGRTGAQELIAEIGVDMTRFPTAGHLVSWAKFAPRARQSAGKSKPGTTGKGSPWLGGTLGEAASAPPGPRPSWAPATTGWPAAAASSAPWSRSATRSWSSPGICCPTLTPGSPTSARTGTTGSRPSAASASSSPNWNAYPARRSSSRRPPPELTVTPSRRHTPPPAADARPAGDRFSIQPGAKELACEHRGRRRGAGLVAR
jgi:transposase